MTRKERTDFVRVGWQVIRDWVLDHPKQLLLAVDAANAEPVQKLDHQPREALERSGNPDVRVHLAAGKRSRMMA